VRGRLTRRSEGLPHFSCQCHGAVCWALTHRLNPKCWFSIAPTAMPPDTRLSVLPRPLMAVGERVAGRDSTSIEGLHSGPQRG